MKTSSFRTGALSLVLLTLTGCARLQSDAVAIQAGEGCRGRDADRWVAEATAIGAGTETARLECALASLRAADATDVPRGLLGSRICLLLATRDRDALKREKLAAEGVRFAERALASAGQGNGELHYYLAANLGFVMRDQITLAMENLPRLRHEMEQAVALSPNVDDGGPLRLLGMLYLKAPAWPAGFGDGDKALDLLRRAVREHPGHPLNHLFLAQALHEVEGDSVLEQARSEWLTGLQKLQQGNWGYSRDAWMQEFEEVQREFHESRG